MKVIYEGGTGEIVEKKSRFIAHVFNIENEENAVDIINKVKKQYWDARHNCFAYVLGDNNDIQRFSDDGEPSGTAGKPILEVLINEKLQNCLVVITRYFGGTLLGTGGLIRAYQASSKEGLANSTIIDIKKGVIMTLDADYNLIGKIQYICSSLGIHIIETEYAEKVKMKFLAGKEESEVFSKKVTEILAGKEELVEGDVIKFGKTQDGEIVYL